jgi:hypothetical protein
VNGWSAMPLPGFILTVAVIHPQLLTVAAVVGHRQFRLAAG